MAETKKKPDETEIKIGTGRATNPATEPVNPPASETKVEAKANPAKPATPARTIWRGPVEGVCLTERGETIFEATLIPGKSYALPDHHPAVAAWKALGFAVAAISPETKEA